MPKLNYTYLKKDTPPEADASEAVEATTTTTPPQADLPDIAEIKRRGKGTIELPNTGGYFIVTYGDQNRNRYGVLFTPEGKPISLR